MKYSILFISFLLCLISCNKKSADSQKTEEEHQDYYQKELVYDGLKGKIDSIISKTYTINNNDSTKRGELISTEIKRFDEKGYIINHEIQSFEDNTLLSAEQTLYTRDERSLVSSQSSNMLASSGDGYTVQYTIADRGMNKEIWEYLRKMPGKSIELSAEIRRYTKDGSKVFSQVGNTDSTTLRYEYKYDAALGKVSDLILYENELPIQHTEKKYDENGMLENTFFAESLNLNIDEDVDKDTIEYTHRYDAQGNPTITYIIQKEEIIAVSENNIYYVK